MAYTELITNTTADAVVLTDNFYAVAHGDKLPLGGVSLTATNNVYDLGSSTQSWNNLYCNHVYAENYLNDFSEIIAEVTLSATAESFTISGLNGDSDYMYRIVISGKNYDTIVASNIRMSFNSDLGVTVQSYYNFLQTEFEGAGAIISPVSNFNSWLLQNQQLVASTTFFISALFSMRRSSYQTIEFISFLSKPDASIQHLVVGGGYRTETTETVTSLTIDSAGLGFASGTTVILFRYNK